MNINKKKKDKEEEEKCDIFDPNTFCLVLFARTIELNNLFGIKVGVSSRTLQLYLSAKNRRTYICI